MSQPRTILTLNSGSSSIKFALFGHESRGERLMSGMAEFRPGGALLSTRDASGTTERREFPETGPEGALRGEMIGHILNHVETSVAGGKLSAVGHRVVHGGAYFTGPSRIDQTALAELDALIPLAPLHQPPSIAPMRRILQDKPDLVQVACFDTSYHHTIPEIRTRLPLPASLIDGGARVYGFHGLSYDFIAQDLAARFPELARKKVLVAHIGNGASLCAMHEGLSVGTTMGLTVLDGLMMGTRCGAIDPGAILYLLQQRNLSPKEVQDTLYYRSGLLGVSGRSNDMRVLREHMSDPQTRLALDMFVERFVQQAGGLIAQMGGIDALVFTGGIGQHDSIFRRDVCKRLEWLGVQICDAANAAGEMVIGTGSASVQVLIIAADEETTIFRHTQSILERIDDS